MMVLVCIGLFALTMGMFFIGYAIGRLEESKNVKGDDYISDSTHLGEFIMEMESQREREERSSFLGDN